MITPPDFPVLLQTFFTIRLIQQRQASPHTITAYRNTFRLLLRFATSCLGRAPSSLNVADLDATFLGRFLDHLEQERSNSARSRNARLAALHAFFRYVALTEPAHALHCQRVLAIPSKRFERGIVEFLAEEEIEALLDSPDTTSWIGRRDRALILVAVQTGLRVSELTALRNQDVTFGRGAHVRCLGKGRKLRCTPLRPDVTKVLKAWLREQPAEPDKPVFPSSRGCRMSEDAVERLVSKHVSAARERCPSLAKKRVTPHTLRHTAAMVLLQKGVDRSVIALWLGHESMETTQIYLHANLQLKEKALARTSPSSQSPGRYRPDDVLLKSWRGCDYPASEARPRQRSRTQSRRSTTTRDNPARGIMTHAVKGDPLPDAGLDAGAMEGVLECGVVEGHGPATVLGPVRAVPLVPHP